MVVVLLAPKYSTCFRYPLARQPLLHLPTEFVFDATPPTSLPRSPQCFHSSLKPFATALDHVRSSFVIMPSVNERRTITPSIRAVPGRCLAFIVPGCWFLITQ